MSDVTEAVRAIIGTINDATSDLDPDERAMVLLYAQKMVECAVELDMADTLRARAKGAGDD